MLQSFHFPISVGDVGIKNINCVEHVHIYPKILKDHKSFLSLLDPLCMNLSSSSSIVRSTTGTSLGYPGSSTPSSSSIMLLMRSGKYYNHIFIGFLRSSSFSFSNIPSMASIASFMSSFSLPATIISFSISLSTASFVSLTTLE